MLESNNRLDWLVSQKLGVSRKQAQTLIQSGNVTVAGIPIMKVAYRPDVEALIEVASYSISSQTQNPQDTLQETWYYEDNDILLLEKPAGMVVHGTGPDTLAHRLMSKQVPLSRLAGDHRWGIVHRLDRDTEGVMVIAKTDLAYHHLTTQFRERQVEKRYYAVVVGDLRSNWGEIDRPIGYDAHHWNRRKIVHNPQDGKPSLTRYEVIRRYNSTTLVRVMPITGRTHQIRVHFASIGHPIVGDPLYLGKSNQQLRLQAYFLSFSHPGGNGKMAIELPLSKRLI